MFPRENLQGDRKLAVIRFLAPEGSPLSGGKQADFFECRTALQKAPRIGRAPAAQCELLLLLVLLGCLCRNHQPLMMKTSRTGPKFSSKKVWVKQAHTGEIKRQLARKAG